MLKKLLIVASTLAAVLVQAPPSFGQDDVGSLLRDCRAERGSPQWSYCLGFISAMIDALSINGLLYEEGTLKAPKGAQFAFCPKGSISPAAMVQAFENWAGNNPALWQESMSVGVIVAGAKVWPCD